MSLKKQGRIQAEALRSAFAAYDASKMRELATKSDLQELRHEFQVEIRSSEFRILKWALGPLITEPALIIAVIGIAGASLLK